MTPPLELCTDELRPMAAEMGNHLCGLFCLNSYNRPGLVIGELVRPLRLRGQGRQGVGQHRQSGRGHHVGPGEVHRVGRLVGSEQDVPPLSSGRQGDIERERMQVVALMPSDRLERARDGLARRSDVAFLPRRLRAPTDDSQG